MTVRANSSSEFSVSRIKKVYPLTIAAMVVAMFLIVAVHTILVDMNLTRS